MPVDPKQVRHNLSYTTDYADATDYATTRLNNRPSQTSDIIIGILASVVPAVWKEAVIIPVPKTGKDKKNHRSDRPMSSLAKPTAQHSVSLQWGACSCGTGRK